MFRVCFCKEKETELKQKGSRERGALKIFFKMCKTLKRERKSNTMNLLFRKRTQHTEGIISIEM